MHLSNITFHMRFCILFVAPHVHLLGFTNGEMCKHFRLHANTLHLVADPYCMSLCPCVCSVTGFIVNT